MEQIIVYLLIKWFSADGENRHWEVRINWPYKLMALRNMNQYLLANRAQVFANCATVTIWAYLVSRALSFHVCLLPRGAALYLPGGPSSWHMVWSGHSHCPTEALFTRWRTLFFTHKKALTVDFSRLKFKLLSSHHCQKALQTWSTAIRFTNAF